MKAILNKLNNYLPMKTFLNYFFITALGDYLQTEINISSLEKEISQKAVIALLGLKLNTAIINERHLSSSPMKLIEGTINRLEMTLSEDKISIHLSEIGLLVMPVFNSTNLFEYQPNQQKPKSSPNPTSADQTLSESIINSMMQNVDITIDSICIKILTYEVFGNSLDNPTLSLFISRINLRNKGDAHKENDFFLYNKEVTLENFCLKIDQYYTQDETIFYNACRLQDEKLLFNFYCSNNTLCAIDYNKGPAIAMSIKKGNWTKGDNKAKEDPMNINFDIDIDVQRIEVIVNTAQIAQLLMFKEICGNIYSNDSHNKSNSNSNSNNSTNKTPLKILGHSINEQSIHLSFELINILINENITAKETPKLFSFYTKELQKTIKTIDEIENHFCYFEDNFFILIIDSIKYSSFDSALHSQMTFEVNQIALDYIEYQSKQPKKTTKLMSKKPSFMKMGSGSKLALSQMQSFCGGDSIYQSAMSSLGNSVYESVLDSELVLIENFNKLIAYDFFSASFRIFCIDKVEVKGYENSTTTLTHSITNCSIATISFDLHFVFLFKVIKMIYTNSYLSKEIHKALSQIQTKVNDNSNSNTIDVKEINTQSNKVNNKQIVDTQCKSKSQVFILIKALSIKLLNFKRDISRIDTNSFFYEFYRENIENYYLNKDSQSFHYQMTPNTPIDSIKSKDYLLLKLSDIRVLNSSKQQEYEIKAIFSSVMLNYNYYTLVSYSSAEVPNMVNKGKKNEYLTELVAPIKPSTVLDHNQELNVSINEIDLNALSNKNEMYLRNNILTIKSQYDYMEHITTIRLSVHFIEDIQVNCEYLLIKQLITYSDTLMFAFNIVQIYQCYCDKIHSSQIEKMFNILNIPKIEIKPIQSQSKTNFFITMDIDNLVLFINRNNTLGKDGNLIKVLMSKLTSNAAFRYDQTLNEAEVDIDDIQVYIQKNTKPKGDIRQSHTSLIKKINQMNNKDNDDSLDYVLLLGKTESSSQESDHSSSSMITLHLYFNNEANSKPEVLKEINKEKVTEDNSYQMFLFQNQLPMPDMSITSKIIITNCYINLIWYDFDMKSNGLSCFIEEISSIDEEEYLNHNNNDNSEAKELIPLCQERAIDLTIAIELQMIYIDLFFASNVIPKTEWMRMIVVVSYAKLKQKEDNSEVMVNQCRFYYLKDFDYNGVNELIEKENSILDLIGDISNETSYLNRIGFIEVCYIQEVNLNKKSNIGNDNGNNNNMNSKTQKINVVLGINAIELFLCKDSFMLLQKFIEKVNQYTQSILKQFSKDKLIIDDDEEEDHNKSEKPKEKTIEVNYSNSIDNNLIIGNGDIVSPLKDNKELIKEYHVIENYCFNPNKFDNQLEEIKEIEAEEDYESIIEAQKKKRLKQRKSFDVLFGDEIENEPSNEGDVQLTASINILRVYLFKGRDFAFISYSQMNKDNMYNGDNSIEKSNTSIKNDQQLVIEENYMVNEGFNQNNIIPSFQSRQRKKQREHFNHICFHLSGFNGDISYYNESEMLLTSSFIISKLTIEDKIKQSKYAKILSKYNYEDNYLPFCSIKLEVNRSLKDQQASNEELQLAVDAQFSPINILVDQLSLLFLLQFFQIKLDLLNDNLVNNSSGIDYITNANDKNVVYTAYNCPIQIKDNYLCDIGEFEQIDTKKPNESKEKSKPKETNEVKISDSNSEGNSSSNSNILIKKISIKEFKLNLSYNSHELSIQQLKRKNYLELLNISNITDFQVLFKGYDRKDLRSLSDTISDLITYWRNDITKNQIVSAVLHSVAVVRPFVAIFDSVFDLIKQPVLSYKNDHSIKKGIGKGIKSFFSTFTTQSLFIGEKSFKTIQKMLGATQSNALNKNSYYKKWMYKINEGKRKYDEHFLKK